VQARGVELPDLGEQFPRHLDGAAFEIIPNDQLPSISKNV